MPLRDDPLDDILSTDTNKRKLETVKDNSQIPKSSKEQPDTIESLNSEIDLLKSKIAALQVKYKEANYNMLQGLNESYLVFLYNIGFQRDHLS